MKRIVLCSLLLLGGCAAMPDPYEENVPPPPQFPETEAPGDQTPAQAPAPARNAAVIALAERAHSDFEEGRLVQAAQTLERALSIAPADAGAWLMLGWVRLGQEHADQAGALVQRVLSLKTTMRQRCLAAALQTAAADARGGWPRAWLLFERATRRCTPQPV